MTVRDIEIIYSRDEKLYYVWHPFFQSSEWFSVAEHPMPVPEEKKRGAFAGALQVEKRDGRRYYRDAYPFAFYEIKSGRREPIGEDTELFKDYASAMHWPEPGTAEYRATAEKLIENHRSLAATAQRTVDYHNEQIAALSVSAHPSEGER